MNPDAHARRTTALQSCSGAGVALVVICCTVKSSVVNAYEALMHKQSTAYRCHLPWLLGASPEDVGRVIGRIRDKHGIYKDVCEQLGVKPFTGKKNEYEELLSKLRAKESMLF